MADIIIAPMQYDNLDAVAALEQQCFSTPWSRQAFKDSIDSDNYEYVAALLSDGGLAGYAGMQVVLDEAEITNIAVDGKLRNRGIASKLLEALVTLCIRRGVKYLHLEVRESNEAARRLYEKSGFEIDGIRKNFYSKPTENAVLMTKIL